MITTGAVEIDAPASVVWDVYTDVERWPEWTASVRSLAALDGGPLAEGRRYRISQPRLPTLVWTVTALTPGSEWTWEQRSPGGVTTARHEVVALGPDRTLVRQVLDQSGPVGGLVGRLTRRMTRRYLDLEGAGLKAASEARHAATRAPSS